MAEENKEIKKDTAKTTKKKATTPSPLIGAQAKPTTLDKTTHIDIDTTKKLIDNIIDAGLTSQLDMSAIDSFTTISNAREQIYQLIDVMAQDSSVSSILRTYAEDVCEMSDSGHIMWCESDNPDISKYVNYILNVMNVDKNIFGWVYCLLKYGDVYLRLFRESDYQDDLFSQDNINKAYSARNILNEEYKDKVDEAVNLNVHKARDHYSYYVEMVADPGTMFELTKYGKTYGYIEVPNEIINIAGFTGSIGLLPNVQTGTTAGISTYGYRLKSNDINIYQADDFVHAYLEDNYSRFPEQIQLFRTETDYNANLNSLTYNVRRGKSLLYDAYKVWREKQLLEASVLLNRLTRSSIIRKVQVEVGDMPKEQVKQTLRRVKELFEQKTALNASTSMSEYVNPSPIENCIYFATHNGQGAITVDSVGGDVNVKDLADLDDWNNKFYASFGIPKQYFGWTEDGAGFNGGSSLTILSSVYAKGVKRVQNAAIQMVTDIINLILLDRGCKSYLNNFTIKMKAPLTQEELDYRANLTERINSVSSMNSLFNDVEDKSRRLEILKSLVNTLNYGDRLQEIIQGEIEEAIEAKKKAEEEAAAGGESGGEADSSDDLDLGDLGDIDGGDEDTDLSPMPESVEENKQEQNFLLENSDNFLVDLTLDESEDLPTPEDVENGEIDFTENE